MDHPSLDCKYLLAVLARFWFQFASLLMVTKLRLPRFKLTVLTLDLDMRLFLVFFLVSFSDNLTALRALIIYTSTLDFMHAVLACFDGSLTIFASFCFFLRFYHLFKYNGTIIIATTKTSLMYQALLSVQSSPHHAEPVFRKE